MLEKLVDLDWLFEKNLMEVKLLQVFLRKPDVFPYTKKDGTTGTREEYGYVRIQLAKGMAKSRFNFSNDEAGNDRFENFVKEYQLDNPKDYLVWKAPVDPETKEPIIHPYFSYDLPIDMVDIDFSVDQKYGGKRTKGTGILTLPIKGWNGDTMFIQFPTKLVNDEYKLALWVTNAYGRYAGDEVSKGVVDIIMSLIGSYGIYVDAPLTMYNGKPLPNGCHTCRYLHRYSSEETGELSISDLVTYGVSKVNNCYCTLYAKTVAQEAYDLYNASIALEKDYVVLRDKDDNVYWTLAGKGRVEYNGRIVGWDKLFEGVCTANCCGGYTFRGATAKGYYSAPLSPSTVFHSNGGKWIKGRPENPKGMTLGYLSGNHIVVSVDNPDYVKMICARKVLSLKHEVREITAELVEYDLYKEYKLMVFTGLKKTLEEEEVDAELLLRMSLEDIIIAPKDMHASLFEDVVNILKINDELFIDATWNEFLMMCDEEKLPFNLVTKKGWGR